MPAEMCVMSVQARDRSLEERSESVLPAREAAKSGRPAAGCDSAQPVDNVVAAAISAGNVRSAAARAGSARLRIWRSKFRREYRPGHAFDLPARVTAVYWGARRVTCTLSRR